jgi:hypothetical protein
VSQHPLGLDPANPHTPKPGGPSFGFQEDRRLPDSGLAFDHQRTGHARTRAVEQRLHAGQLILATDDVDVKGFPPRDQAPLGAMLPRSRTHPRRPDVDIAQDPKGDRPVVQPGDLLPDGTLADPAAPPAVTTDRAEGGATMTDAISLVSSLLDAHN